MQLKNTESTYGIITRVLHALMAVIIIGLLALGLYMTQLPVGALKLKLYGWHKEFGLLILMLAMLRIVWRVGNLVPLLPATIPAWQKLAAHAVHWAFYAFMFLLPITGWLMSSTAGIQVSFFGLFLMPNLIPADETAHVFFRETHHLLAFALIATFGLHVLAALKHHFINKDNVLRRMFW
jgi:cytochrome b561